MMTKPWKEYVVVAIAANGTNFRLSAASTRSILQAYAISTIYYVLCALCYESA